MSSLPPTTEANRYQAGWRLLGWGFVALVILVLIAVGLLSNWPRALSPADEGPHQVLSGPVLVAGVAVARVADGVAFQVSDQGPAAIRLPDGSMVEFDAGSQAVLHTGVAGLRHVVELIAGGGQFAVEKGEGAFQVETPHGSVTALGNHFSVKMAADELKVTVSSGVVFVEAFGRPAFQASPETRIFKPHEKGHDHATDFQGRLTAIDEVKVWAVRKDDAQPREFPLSASVLVFIDGQLAQKADLKGGMLVFLQYREGDDQVVGIQAEGPTVGGVVRSVAPSAYKINLAGARTNGLVIPDQLFSVSPTAKVKFNGRLSRLENLAPGSGVTLKLAVDGQTVLAIDGRNQEKGE